MKSNDGPKYKYGISPEFFGFFARDDGAFYVYLLLRPNGEPFYVGKGMDDRINDHEKEAKNGGTSYKCRVIRKIWEHGGKVKKEIVFRTDNEDEAYQIEARLIAKFQKQLTNVHSQHPFWNGQVYSKPGQVHKTKAERQAQALRNLDKTVSRLLSDLKYLKKCRWRFDDQDEVDREIRELDELIDWLVSEYEQRSFWQE